MALGHSSLQRRLKGVRGSVRAPGRRDGAGNDASGDAILSVNGVSKCAADTIRPSRMCGSRCLRSSDEWAALPACRDVSPPSRRRVRPLRARRDCASPGTSMHLRQTSGSRDSSSARSRPRRDRSYLLAVAGEVALARKPEQYDVRRARHAGSIAGGGGRPDARDGGRWDTAGRRPQRHAGQRDAVCDLREFLSAAAESQSELTWLAGVLLWNGAWLASAAGRYAVLRACPGRGCWCPSALQGRARPLFRPTPPHDAHHVSGRRCCRPGSGSGFCNTCCEHASGRRRTGEATARSSRITCRRCWAGRF